MSASPSAIVRRSRQSIWPAITVEEAIRIVEEHAEYALLTDRTRTVFITDIKTGDILAENVVATKAHPEVRTSVKDGYAVVAKINLMRDI
ncbi:Uncharacterized protein BM_BM5625 [Brugia malayi]|uniref:Bm5625, isoform a n=1 Tax=Brugia malayi TaxID=6279 RepID=A0A0K0JJM8_BRUMA|nr:Uncharacterized protein BM_BM5625 [Brugia malayi]CDP96122.1 Bm5625, isoform c [Brugia malayi]VIO98598.1 Uncharacterized protein BM_BM5625 [Brugia malayi]